MNSSFSYILLNSADRETGTVSAAGFNLGGQSVSGATGATLVSATIPWAAAMSGVGYIRVVIPEIGARVLASNGKTQTFLIPINENVSSGSRVYYSQSDFDQSISFGQAVDLRNIGVYFSDGSNPITPGGDWQMVLKLFY